MFLSRNTSSSCVLRMEKQYFVFLFRTPVRWLKFRPEKPMGEILEEGDKDDGEKKEGGEGEEGAQKAPSEKKDGSTEDATVAKEVRCKLEFMTVLSIRFEGGCPSTAARSLKQVLVSTWKKFSNTQQLGMEYPLELWQVQGFIESTAL